MLNEVLTWLQVNADGYKPHDWEFEVNFDPLGALGKRSDRGVKWIDLKGKQVGAPCGRDVPLADMVPDSLRVEDLKFRDPDSFVAGELHEHVDVWEKVCGNDEEGTRVMEWIKGGVDLHDFMVPFEGKYGGDLYDHKTPPRKTFKNSPTCKDFLQFIAETLEERITNGSLEVVGRVGECNPPQVVSGITIEPEKPRMCVNLRYLNCWMKDTPFKLDTLVDLPKVLDKGAYLTSLDDKSSYDHVKVTEDSRQLLGLAFQGWYFVYTTIPFGWKNAAFVYQTVNRQPISYLRRLSIVGFVYIDDRLFEKYRRARTSDELTQSLLAIAIACRLLIWLGFTLSLKKSVFVPTQVIRFLGLLTDTIRQAFTVPEDKKLKCRQLREYVLSQETIPVQTLQRFQGKCVSLLLAVPAAKLYIREMAVAISAAIREGKAIEMSQPLKDEVSHWRFLDGWAGFLPWRDERHISIKMSTDSSNFKWGGVVDVKGKKQVVGDYWPTEFQQYSIMVLEARALLKVLQAFEMELRNHRVDALVDNLALMYSWEKEGSRSRELNVALKDIFQFTVRNNVLLKLSYVPSGENEADAPSRDIRKSDSMLSEKGWEMVQKAFGGTRGHEVDLMALDSNVMVAKDGKPLPHFTPHPTPGSAGVNVFSQYLDKGISYYVFPPFTLIPSVLRFIEVQEATSTMVIPCPSPLPAWFPKLLGMTEGARLLGQKGDREILMYPTKKGYKADKVGLAQPLWAVRVSPKGSLGDKTFSTRLLRGVRNMSVESPIRLLITSDSMLRFLLTSELGRDPLVHVFAAGGAWLAEVLTHALRLSESVKPLVLVLHAGVNNLQARGGNEYNMMTVFMKDMDQITLFRNPSKDDPPRYPASRNGFWNKALPRILSPSWQPRVLPPGPHWPSFKRMTSMLLASHKRGAMAESPHSYEPLGSFRALTKFTQIFQILGLFVHDIHPTNILYYIKL